MISDMISFIMCVCMLFLVRTELKRPGWHGMALSMSSSPTNVTVWLSMYLFTIELLSEQSQWWSCSALCFWWATLPRVNPGDHPLALKISHLSVDVAVFCPWLTDMIEVSCSARARERNAPGLYVLWNVCLWLSLECDPLQVLACGMVGTVRWQCCMCAPGSPLPPPPHANGCRLLFPGIQFRLPTSCSVDRAQPPPGKKSVSNVTAQTHTHTHTHLKLAF